MHRRLVVLPAVTGLLVGAWLLAAVAAEASPDDGGDGTPPAPLPGLQLDWMSDDPTCADGAQVVHADVARLLGGRSSAVELKAQVVVTRRGDEWAVRLETSSRNHTGLRQLVGETCAEVSRAIGLLLAMTIEAEEADTVPTPAEDPVAPPPPPPPASRPRGPTPAPPSSAGLSDEGPSPDTARVRRWAVRGEGQAGLDLLPGFSLGVGGAIALRLGSWELAVGGAHWPGTRTPILDGAGALEVSRQSLEIGACWAAWRSAELEFGPCATPQLTFTHSRTTGIDRTQNGALGVLMGLSAGAEFRYAPAGLPWFVALRPGLIWEKSQPFRVLPINCAGCAPIYVFETVGLAAHMRAGVGARF